MAVNGIIDGRLSRHSRGKREERKEPVSKGQIDDDDDDDPARAWRMRGLTRGGTAKPVSRYNILSANGDYTISY